MSSERKGLYAQRNQAPEGALDRFDIITFDDDFLAATTYPERLLAAFAAHADWAVIRGNVTLDGVRGPGLSFESYSFQPDALSRARLRDWALLLESGAA